MSRRKKMLVALSIVGVVVVLVAVGFWWMKQQPLYRPGMARGFVASVQAGGTVTSAGPEPWQVEPGISLFHFEEGSGRPVLVVHGGPGIPFRKPMAGMGPLTVRYRFHYYDQRGCGRSTRPFDRFADSSFYKNFRTVERTLGLGAQIADIERIRRLLGQEKLILVGHSFGALIASLYAAEFPERVAGLLLVAPADQLVMPPPSGGLFAQVSGMIPQSMREEYEAFMAEYLDFQKLFERTEAEVAELNMRLERFYVEAARAKGLAVSSEPSGEWGGFMVQAQYLSGGLRHDYRAALRAVTAPVLIVHGAEDLQPESVSRSYAESFPNARVVVMDNAGHMSFAEQPEQFAAIAGPFLDGIE